MTKLGIAFGILATVFCLRADTIHPLESEQVPGRIHHSDC